MSTYPLIPYIKFLVLFIYHKNAHFTKVSLTHEKTNNNFGFYSFNSGYLVYYIGYLIMDRQHLILEEMSRLVDLLDGGMRQVDVAE